jgi:hypothetical protein
VFYGYSKQLSLENKFSDTYSPKRGPCFRETRSGSASSELGSKPAVLPISLGGRRSGVGWIFPIFPAPLFALLARVSGAFGLKGGCLNVGWVLLVGGAGVLWEVHGVCSPGRRQGECFAQVGTGLAAAISVHIYSLLSRQKLNTREDCPASWTGLTGEKGVTPMGNRGRRAVTVRKS